MKIILLSSLYLLGFMRFSYCQDPLYVQQPSVGLHVFLDAFSYQDSLHAPGKFNNRRIGIALNYLKGITPRTDFNLNLAGSFLAFPGIDKEAGDKQLLLEGDVSIREKLFTGRRTVNPFLQAGLGVSHYADKFGVFIPAGPGLQVNLPGEAFLLFHTQYRIPLTTTQSGHFYASIGIAGIIGRKKLTKKKPVTITPVRTPHATASGKDSDGDGIVDSLDACPFIPGLSAYKGCPVPDRDKDGVNDEDDKCPDLAGDRRNAGCPLVQNDLREKMESAAKNVFFETDSYKLLPTSYEALNKVARILKDNLLLKLDIEGHTDNTGAPEKNQTLSERRAASVLEYLSARAGIAKERLSSAGYGSTHPVTDNGTPEGRAMNRRVEFKLKYF